MSRPTSPSSPGSEGSTSPSKPTDTDASDRSNGTPTAPESSSDGGRLFPDGETSPRSGLLPTPKQAARNSRRALTQQHFSDLALEQAIEVAQGILPRELETWEELPPQHRTSSSEGSPASPPPPPADGKEPPTTAGSGRRSPVSLASYDPELSSWRTSQVSLLSTEDERFPRSSERWPTSGMTRRGRAFALPMSVPATSVSGSSYLHTPTTGDTAPSYDHRASPGYTRAVPVPNLAAQIEEGLLPTPVGTDAKAARNRTSGRKSGSQHHDGVTLSDAMRSLGEPTDPQSEGGSE